METKFKREIVFYSSNGRDGWKPWENVVDVDWWREDGKVGIRFADGKDIAPLRRNLAILKLQEFKIVSPPFVSVVRLGSTRPVPGVRRVAPYFRDSYAGIDAWGVEYEDGSVEYRTSLDVRVSLSPGPNLHSRMGVDGVLRYLAGLAEKLGLCGDDGTSLLGRQFAKIGFIPVGDPLYGYLSASPGDVSDTPVTEAPVFPFGCNRSQYEAVVKALGNRWSVIEGPPGTGKTQTILNIIANLVMAGKTVQVVSNNNSAVDNVLEKMERLGLGFICAKLGSRANKEAFYASQPPRGDVGGWRLRPRKRVKLLSRVPGDSRAMEEVYGRRERLSDLRAEHNRLLPQRYHFRAFLKESHIIVPPRRRLPPSGRLAGLLRRCRAEGPRRRIVTRVLLWLALGRTLRDVPPADVCYVLESYWLDAREAELRREMAPLEKREGKDAAFEKRFLDLSLLLFRDAVARRFSGASRRPVFAEKDVFFDTGGKARKAFLSEYPVVLSTTFSALSNLGPDGKFDYLIMDEASQVDIVTGALALHSARRVVVVGDMKQLPNVVTPKDRWVADEAYRTARDTVGMHKAYDYAGNSFLSSVCSLFGGYLGDRFPRTLLREHYRCHPMIIGFCNSRFYGGQLRVMTCGGPWDGALALERTTAGFHARGTENMREAETVVECVSESLPGRRQEDVGVIAPYNDQVDLVKDKLRGAGMDGVQVGTVHAFQGREKGVVLLSTVDNRAREFVDDPHLVNVAVSRAKDRFVLVTSGNPQEVDSNVAALMDYIAYNGGEVREGRIRSVFDLLYGVRSDDLREYLSSRRRVSGFDSENLVYGLLKDVLRDRGLDGCGIAYAYPLRELVVPDGTMTAGERRYLSRSWTHVDFLVYDRTTLRPFFAVEVDGWAYHKKGTPQSERDVLKDSVLGKAGLPLLRLSTVGSSEEEKIVGMLAACGLV